MHKQSRRCRLDLYLTLSDVLSPSALLIEGKIIMFVLVFYYSEKLEGFFSPSVLIFLDLSEENHV